jgi:hypothetical protein
VEHLGDRAVLPVVVRLRELVRCFREWWHPVAHLARTRSRPARAFVFTDRDLYRPGERVFLAAVCPLMARYSNSARPTVMHDFAGWFTPTLMLVRESSNERAATFSRFGTSADSFYLAPGSTLGYYQVGVAAPARRAVAACQSGDVRGEGGYRAPEVRHHAQWRQMCRTSWGIR